MHFDYRMLKQVAGGLGLGRFGERGRDRHEDDRDEMSPPEDWSELVRREIREQPSAADLKSAQASRSDALRSHAPRPIYPHRTSEPGESVEAVEEEDAPVAPAPPAPSTPETAPRAARPERPAAAPAPARPSSLARGVYEFIFDPSGRELPPTERLDDPEEALSIELEPGTPGHLHLVRGRASDIHAESAWVDIYLSARHDLPESAFDEESGLYRSEEAARLLRVELGSLRRQARPGSAPGRINESPDLRFDRPVASTADWTP